jgi:hypothetical protein
LDLLPRAYLVHNVLAATDADQAVALVAAGDFDPADTAVVEGLAGFNTVAVPGDDAILLSYAPGAAGWLVIAGLILGATVWGKRLE